MSYAGDVTPEQAWTALRAEPGAVLVDVRTRAEWAYVGLPDLGEIGKEVVLVEWQTFPEGSVNERFTADLEAAGVAKDAAVYFICRSGVRSISAAEAATREGWNRSYNVTEGFEGPHDVDRHRTLSGWKVAGLPWVQG
ncbi:rhodanese-like domain-containing protein [Terrabacter sp. GCM10028922]|jgi:rhodanese-related sulfurtransferase|uniref:rhodanese-like domain-containing protein n=1 Tax=Terrabacter sp. GCM10028922 TaxID=3273428 RepID=UPI00360F3C0E